MLDDADIDTAAPCIARGAMLHSRRDCMPTERIVDMQPVAEAFKSKLFTIGSKLKVCNPFSDPPSACLPYSARPLRVHKVYINGCFAGNKWGISRPRTLEDIRASLKGRVSAEVTSEQKGKARTEPVPEEFLKQRKVMKERFPDGRNPPRKLSREAMDGLRALHADDPETFNTPAFAEKFRISPEAVRRILKSKWLPKAEQRVKLLEKERRWKEEFKMKRIEENVVNMIKEAKDDGAKVLLGDLSRQVALVQPHLVVDVKPGMRL